MVFVYTKRIYDTYVCKYKVHTMICAFFPVSLIPRHLPFQHWFSLFFTLIPVLLVLPIWYFCKSCWFSHIPKHRLILILYLLFFSCYFYRAILRRGFAFSASIKNPPLLKSRNIQSQTSMIGGTQPVITTPQASETAAQMKDTSKQHHTSITGPTKQIQQKLSNESIDLSTSNTNPKQNPNQNSQTKNEHIVWPMTSICYYAAKVCFTLMLFLTLWLKSSNISYVWNLVHIKRATDLSNLQT